jgi:hypothetical protein
MSHTTKTAAGIRNAEGLRRAVKRIKGASYHGQGTTQLFNEQVAGHIVSLPDFHYKVAVNLKTGEILSDTYNGKWGDPKLLDKLAQGYAVECGHMEAEQKGHQFTEIPLDDGSIKCTITIGGDNTSLSSPTNALGDSAAPSL